MKVEQRIAISADTQTEPAEHARQQKKKCFQTYEKCRGISGVETVAKSKDMIGRCFHFNNHEHIQYKQEWCR